MEISAKLNNLRIAPRKVRLVVDLIRGKKAEQAENILKFATKKGAPVVLKLLHQATANAKNNFQAEKSNLFIKKITVDEGPKYKRWRPRSRGQAYEIQKKTSHITIVLDVLSPVGKRKKAKKAGTEKEAKKATVLKTRQEERDFARPKTEKPKAKMETEIKKPFVERSIKRIFRRKAI